MTRSHADQEDAILVGIRPSPARGCQNRTSDAFLSLASLRAVIDSSSQGHKWTPPASADNGSSSNTDSSTTSQSTAREADVALEPPPFLDDAIGYVRITNGLSARFGAPIVLIAPRFAVTRTLWLSESGVLEASGPVTQTLAAVFSSEVVAIKRVVSGGGTAPDADEFSAGARDGSCDCRPCRDSSNCASTRRRVASSRPRGRRRPSGERLGRAEWRADAVVAVGRSVTA